MMEKPGQENREGRADEGCRPARSQGPGGLHGGRREEAARRYGLPKEEFLDFSASINPLGPPSAAQRALRRAMTGVSHYPETGGWCLEDSMAGYLGVFPDEVVPGNGSIEVIYWLAAHLKPRRVLIIEPTFSEYRRACEAVGARCDSLYLEGDDSFALDVLQVEPEGYDLVFLCNPNNPTGYLVPIEEVALLWRNCRMAGAGLVVDEAFMDFVGHGQSILSYGVSEGLYVVRSFTKSHAIPGLRLGCLVAASEAAAGLRAVMPPWNINAFAHAAGEAAIEDWQYLEATRDTVRAARMNLFNDLRSITGIDPLPSEANYLLCRLEGISSADLADAMGRQGILVRDCGSFNGLGGEYIRVAVRSDRENYQLVATLRRVLEGSRDELMEEAPLDSFE
ncbi:MAG: threonine-phosphate decarboxylase [Gaiellales bacterium]|nr:MAG: threonine-phosphate decarboxylase [Gaiellales bacterium]